MTGQYSAAPNFRYSIKTLFLKAASEKPLLVAFTCPDSPPWSKVGPPARVIVL